MPNGLPNTFCADDTEIFHFKSSWIIFTGNCNLMIENKNNMLWFAYVNFSMTAKQRVNNIEFYKSEIISYLHQVNFCQLVTLQASKMYANDNFKQYTSLLLFLITVHFLVLILWYIYLFMIEIDLCHLQFERCSKRYFKIWQKNMRNERINMV